MCRSVTSATHNMKLVLWPLSHHQHVDIGIFQRYSGNTEEMLPLLTKQQIASLKWNLRSVRAAFYLCTYNSGNLRPLKPLKAVSTQSGNDVFFLRHQSAGHCLGQSDHSVRRIFLTRSLSIQRSVRSFYPFIHEFKLIISTVSLFILNINLIICA